MFMARAPRDARGWCDAGAAQVGVQQFGAERIVIGQQHAHGLRVRVGGRGRRSYLGQPFVHV
jgi:hypothetical protein